MKDLAMRNRNSADLSILPRKKPGFLFKLLGALKKSSSRGSSSKSPGRSHSGPYNTPRSRSGSGGPSPRKSRDKKGSKNHIDGKHSKDKEKRNGQSDKGSEEFPLEEELEGIDIEDKEEIKKRPGRETLEVGGLEDLPQHMQKMVKKAGLDKEKLQESQNFLLLLNCLHFLTRVAFIFKAPGEQPVDLAKYRSSKLDISKLPAADEVLKTTPIKKDFRVSKDKVGQGGFGTVYAGKRLKGKNNVAIKKMPHVNHKNKTNNFQEIYFLRIVDHPNIVKYDCCYQVLDELWLIMEFMEGGTLRRAVQLHHFTEAQIAYVAHEILLGIQYLHSINLVHRDLKSENVMMSINGDVKIIDFGLCTEATNEQMTNNELEGMVGSPFWMPPEMIRREKYGPAVDLWSLGICICELANGSAPFQSCPNGGLKAMYTAGMLLGCLSSYTEEDTKATILPVTQGYPQPFKKPQKWSAHFKEFLSLCLSYDPNGRTTAGELLRHQFLKKRESKKQMKQLLSGLFLQTEISNVGF